LRRHPGPAFIGANVFYIVESSKSFQEACFDFEPVVQRLGFVMLHRHDLVDLLGAKDGEFDDACSIYEIGNYRQTEKLLSIDMRLAIAMPWRIAIFTENGATKIGVLRSSPRLSEICQNAALASLALEIDEKICQIIDEVR
jgi:uncharacterized protein (DUF302 family)